MQDNDGDDDNNDDGNTDNHIRASLFSRNLKNELSMILTIFGERRAVIKLKIPVTGSKHILLSLTCTS